MTYIHFLGAVALLAASASAWMQSHHHHDVSSVHSRVTGRVAAKERFVRQRSKINLSNSWRRIGSVLASTTDGFDRDDDDNDWEDGTLDGSAMAPEKSQMNSFVRNFRRGSHYKIFVSASRKFSVYPRTAHRLYLLNKIQRRLLRLTATEL